MPTPGESLLDRPIGLFRYLAQTEVHTYAFSVAANAILSLFPFIVMMFTIARHVFHSRAMESVIGEMIRYFLPAGQDFVVKNMAIVAHARKGVQLASLVMLLISSTGVFMPLECALNRVWGVTRNRSYLMNQLVAFGLAVSIGALAMISIALTAAQHSVLEFLFFGHTQNLFYRIVAHWLLQISAAIASILLFFLIYWILPNRKLPARAVLPTAIVVGLLWELAKMAYVLSSALAGFSCRLRAILDLRELDDVGLPDGLAPLGGSAQLGLALRPPLGGSSGSRAGKGCSRPISENKLDDRLLGDAEGDHRDRGGFAPCRKQRQQRGRRGLGAHGGDIARLRIDDKQELTVRGKGQHIRTLADFDRADELAVVDAIDAHPSGAEIAHVEKGIVRAYQAVHRVRADQIGSANLVRGGIDLGDRSAVEIGDECLSAIRLERKLGRCLAHIEEG